MSTYGISQCRLGIPASRAPCCNQCQKHITQVRFIHEVMRHEITDRVRHGRHDVQVATSRQDLARTHQGGKGLGDPIGDR